MALDEVLAVNVTMLADPGNADGTLGGAELTMREFLDAAPTAVNVVEFDDADTVIVGNCVTFGLDLIDRLDGKHVVKYWNDVGPHVHPLVKAWLKEYATEVYCSPLQARAMGAPAGICIPPPVNLNPFRNARNGRRDGACAVGAWQNPGKGQQLLREWADKHGPVDVYGTGPFLPIADSLRLMGPLAYSDVPATLARYETFVHLPTALEPFGRGVVEAWASGCSLVVNRMVGATYWITEAPMALESAAADFWRVVGHKHRRAVAA